MNKVYLNDILIENYDELKQYRISIDGNNNIIKINDFNGPALVFISIKGNNCTFTFGKNNIVRNDLSINYWDTVDSLPDSSEIYIGNDNFFNGSNIVFISPLNTKIIIGNGNLFAGSICFWGRNDHIIYNLKTRIRRNYDANIEVGNQNWIGQNSSFLPGGCIGNNNVVGYGSIVNKNIKKNNVLIAGIPAKVKVKGINWSRASRVENIDYDNNNRVCNINER